ncbi:putative Melatonin-related receptor [Hypsibius exemplaris]|uniref:Melatonin-related receptor n=1 Tax=Hypsibius exemplaris TaxID=2072580 RepID=A0A9X6NNM4_HYPEX|nr:putative Melatonin-related receptor [Hypsibius exemplaris]
MNESCLGFQPLVGHSSTNSSEIEANTTGCISSNGTDGLVRPALYLRSHHPLEGFVFAILTVGAIFGTVGNILVLLTILLVRSLRTVGNFFIFNLALADALISIIIDPFHAAGSLAGEKLFLNQLYDPNMLCDMIGAVCGPTCLSSLWNMCAISLNRYILICHPHLYHKIFTRQFTIAICIGIWIGCALAHAPNYFGWGRTTFNTDMYLCGLDVVAYPSYAIFYMTLGAFVPLVGVLFGYLKIFLKVRAVKQKVQSHNPHGILAVPGPFNAVGSPEIREKVPPGRSGIVQDDIRLIKTLFLAFFIFYVSWLPIVILYVLTFPPNIPKWVVVVAVCMAHGNSAANPILYGMCNEKIRDGYRRVLHCRTSRSRNGVIAKDFIDAIDTDAEVTEATDEELELSFTPTPIPVESATLRTLLRTRKMHQHMTIGTTGGEGLKCCSNSLHSALTLQQICSSMKPPQQSGVPFF